MCIRDRPNGCDSLRGMTASFVEYFVGISSCLLGLKANRGRVPLPFPQVFEWHDRKIKDNLSPSRPRQSKYFCSCLIPIQQISALFLTPPFSDRVIWSTDYILSVDFRSAVYCENDYRFMLWTRVSFKTSSTHTIRFYLKGMCLHLSVWSNYFKNLRERHHWLR